MHARMHICINEWSSLLCDFAYKCVCVCVCMQSWKGVRVMRASVYQILKIRSGCSQSPLVLPAATGITCQMQ